VENPTSRLVATICPIVATPETLTSVAVTKPTVVIPVTFTSDNVLCASTFKVWSVLIPVTFRSLNVFGAATIAASIVAVVTASREAIFFNCLAPLITSLDPILSEPVVVTPVTFTLVALNCGVSTLVIVVTPEIFVVPLTSKVAIGMDVPIPTASDVTLTVNV
jgi:hypothetical protein